MQEGYAQISGLRTHFFEAGDAQRPAVVLLHGLGNAASSWKRNVDALGQAFHVIAPDLPGHGWSDKPRLKDPLASGTRFLAALLDHFGIAKAHLVGSSMGGIIAIQFAMAPPPRVERLVLVDSAGLGRDMAPFLRALTVPLLDRLVVRYSRRSVEAFLDFVIYNKSAITPELVQDMTDARMQPGARDFWLRTLRWGASVFGLRRRVILIDSLSQLHVPVLLLWGDHDRVLPPRLAHQAVPRLPGAQLHVFHDCGHWPHVEYPDEFNRLVMGFLSGQDSFRPKESQGAVSQLLP